MPEQVTLRTITDCEHWLKENDSPGDDAYDGSNVSQRRELTARERDVLCRFLRWTRRTLREEARGQDERLYTPFLADQHNLDLVRIEVLLAVLDPRRTEHDDE